ncbi:MAG: alanine racemase [Treponema sp.]|nr:alanine racemase [Treponema sp.]
MQATQAIINLDNLRKNITLVQKKTGKRICMPVKADAYGHGALSIARTALSAGVEYLAVSTVEEGRKLREAGINAPIILFSIVLPEEIDFLISADLEPMAGDSEYIDVLESRAVKAKKKLPVHLKIDTGMGRIGCNPADAPALASQISKSKGLHLAGTATHLAVSDSVKPEDAAYTKMQLDIFCQAVEKIKNVGINPGIVHAANTGAVTFHNDSWFDMVRPGILLYGYAPENPEGIPALEVLPLMELRSTLVFIKEVKKGQSISYGRIWTAKEDTFVGTIPLGYADGLNRLLSNNWQVLLLENTGRDNRKLRPLAGRICMDQCMIDLGRDSTARRWDPVTIFGGLAPHAGIMASLLSTIPYEITCNINKRVPRVYIE